jgi:hypothetical protein
MQRQTKKLPSQRSPAAPIVIMSVERASFLGLPPELRNQIYDYLFGYGECGYWNPVLSFRGVRQCTCEGFQLLWVCRETRQMAWHTYFDHHPIRFILYKANRVAIESYLDMVSPKGVASIHRFQVKGYKSQISNHTRELWRLRGWLVHSCRNRPFDALVVHSSRDIKASSICKACGSKLLATNQHTEVDQTQPSAASDGHYSKMNTQLLSKEILNELFTEMGWASWM